MYGVKIGPSAATGLGAVALGENMGWVWFFVALLVVAAIVLVARPIAQHRRQAVLNGTAPVQRRSAHVQRRNRN